MSAEDVRTWRCPLGHEWIGEPYKRYGLPPSCPRKNAGGWCNRPMVVVTEPSLFGGTP